MNKRAETLAEVLIALSVISMGAAGTSTLVTMSIKANGQSEERIVAYNLAREGVEAIRNVRDTNWLRFPGNRTECWDTLDAESPSECETSTKLGDKEYWVSLELDTTNSLLKWIVTEEDNNPATDDDLLYINRINNHMIYTHKGSDEPSIYHRTVTITKDTSGVTESMKINSKVWWTSRGSTVSVTFADELSNY